MAGYKKTAPNGPAEKHWYGDCVTCGKETRKVTAHVLIKKTHKVPACMVCKNRFEPGASFTKR